LIVGKTRLDHEKALKEALNSLLIQLRRFPVKKAILFGSVARGKVKTSSDLDLLVIFDDGEDFKSRMKKLYEAIELPVDFDLLAYSEKEFERLKERPFFRHILKEGKVIYEPG